ncbi:MAG: PAS domain-containing protein [Nitrospinae bacterium]|nr:PAS domain-containing protein [Nitrospinota bacterium]
MTPDKLVTLFDRLQYGVCECDMEKGVIKWINRAGADIFGYKSPEDMIGMNITDNFVDTEDKKKLTNALRKDGIVRNFIIKAKRIDNSIFYLEGTYGLIKDEADGSIKMEGIINDVTGRKVLEYRTINEERLEAILQIVRTARHEINNPLTGILGNLELLLLEEKNKEGESDCKKLKTIYDLSLRIKDVVQNMSTISKAIEKDYAGDMKMIDLEKSKGV